MLNETLGYNYILKRLVFVNSASHGYSEIMLDEHLAMFGNNNRGKTASLAATKLLLYPEDNFNKCETKFNFTSKSGRQYTKFESYDYYFPTDNSFLLLEVVNPTGSFCMVLYRAADFKYHRMFIQKPYDELRHLFWDSVEEKFAATLGIENLKKALKTFNGRHVTHKADLERIMYASFANAESQYCIVPLKDHKASSIKAFISIYELAFNSGKGEEKSLPEAIATIIEMQRGRDEEKLEANFIELQRQYEDLWQQGQQLQNLENNQDSYHKLKGTFERLTKAQQDYSLAHCVLKHKLDIEQENYGHKTSELTQKIGAKAPAVKANKDQIEQLKQKIHRIDGQLAEIQQETITLRDKKRNVEQYLGDTNQDVMTAQTALNLQLETLTEQLQASEDVARAHQNLKIKQQQRQEQTALSARLQATLDNLSNTLVAQLSPHGAAVLTSLNSELMTLSATITDEERTTIEHFAALFSEQSNHLAFKDKKMSLQYQAYNIEQQRLQLQNDYDNSQKTLARLGPEITNLQLIIRDSADKNLTALNQQSMMQKLKATEQLLNAVKGYAYICDELARKQDALQASLVTQETLAQAAVIETERFNLMSGELEALHQQKKDLNDAFSNFEHIANMLNRANNTMAVHDCSKSDESFQQMATIWHLTADNSLKIMEQASDLKLDIAKFTGGFETFIREIEIKDVDPYLKLHQLEDCGDILARCKNLFETLNYQKTALNTQIGQHNQYLSNMIQELENAHKILSGTIQAMNQTLESQPVSNFAAVRLKLKIRADFDNLLDNCRKHDISEQSLMEGNFYQMLLNYVQEHFNNQSKRIKMADLIDAIHYEYIGYDNSIETKAQSGGTTSTVTSFIISILLNKIFMTDHTLKIPVVIDEVADIDTHNMKNIVAQITKAGFAIFCATPTFSAVVCQHIKNYVHIDSSRLKTERYVAKCELHIMPAHINRFGITTNES